MDTTSVVDAMVKTKAVPELMGGSLGCAVEPEERRWRGVGQGETKGQIAGEEK